MMTHQDDDSSDQSMFGVEVHSQRANPKIVCLPQNKIVFTNNNLNKQ